jgi:inosine-uridine nucleoside N-ribohydrolase
MMCIGNLNKVDIEIRLDKKFIKKIKKLVVMGGRVEGVGNIKKGIELKFYVEKEEDLIVLNYKEN